MVEFYHGGGVNRRDAETLRRHFNRMDRIGRIWDRSIPAFILPNLYILYEILPRPSVSAVNSHCVKLAAWKKSY